jgi:dTDP-4-amino-4,6-dideoxygalactose transaminase
MVASGKDGRMIPVAKPWIGADEADAVLRPLLSGWVTQGPEVAEFEREFASYVGAPYACAVANCSVALHLALLAVGVQPGDEVITVSHSFIASANSVRYCGAVPVFIDIQPETFNIDPSLIEQAITERTRAILCVHQIGMPCDMEAITRIARHHNLPVVEDAACAIGSEVNWNGTWERIGKPHGDIACFSLHPRKLLTTGDGGILTTADPDIDRRLRMWRQHSMDVPDTARHGAAQVIFESYPEIGFNYRLTDIQAAIGRVQLQRLPEVLERRRHQVDRYRELLADVPGLVLPIEPAWARSNWQSFCVRLPDGVDQRAAMQSMLDAGVSTRRGVMCAHREPAYAREPWSCGEPLPACSHASSHCSRLTESERAQDRAIILPLFHEMTDAEQDLVAMTLRIACAASTRAERVPVIA